MKIIVLCLLLFPIVAHSSEATCLSTILWAESRGEPLEGIIAIGQSAISKANREHTTICKLKGVQRLKPANNMSEYFDLLSIHMITNPSTNVSRGADHWDVGRPHMKGRITRQINKHVFYILKGR